MNRSCWQRPMTREAEYCQHVLPEKLRLAKDYIEHSSLRFDLIVILRTIAAMFSTRAGRESA